MSLGRWNTFAVVDDSLKDLLRFIQLVRVVQYILWYSAERYTFIMCAFKQDFFYIFSALTMSMFSIF